MYSLLQGDCLELLKAMPDNSVDAIVCDPPAGIGFMGKAFDSDRGGKYQWIAWLAEIMTECKRVLKPGGHALVWALPRTSHWTANAIEDSGFELRDCVTHLFGAGFPKSYDIAKGLEALTVNGSASWNGFRNLNGKKKPAKTGSTANGFVKLSERNGYRPSSYQAGGLVELDPTTEIAKRYKGWGSALKPATEFWWLARKPLERGCSIAANVLKWGVGGLNLDACRVPATENLTRPVGQALNSYNWASQENPHKGKLTGSNDAGGRFPPNLILSHSLFCQLGECSNDCPVRELDVQSGLLSSGSRSAIKGKFGKSTGTNVYGDYKGGDMGRDYQANEGGASRFYPQFRYSQDELDELSSIFHYFPKASQSDRNAGLEDMPLKTKVFNGRSGKSSEDVRPIEERFTTSTKNFHPCVKSQALMKWLTNLITPKGGTVLDPFMGSGSTGVACITGNFNFIGFELELDYFQLAELRIKWAAGESGLFGDLEMSNG